MKSHFEIEANNKHDDFFLFFFLPLIAFIHSFIKSTAQTESPLYGRLGVGTEYPLTFRGS